MRNKEDEIYRYKEFPPEELMVLSLISGTWLGSLQELKTKDTNSENKDPGEMWMWVNEVSERLARAGSDAAFKTALALLEFPDSVKSQAEDPEKFRQWMRGTGFAILSLPETQGFLQEELGGESSPLFSVIKEALEFDTHEFDTKEKDYVEPRTYNKFAAVAAGMNLRNSQPGTKGHELFKLADNLRNEPYYEQQIRDYYWVIPDCQNTVRLIYSDQPKEWIPPIAS